MDLNDPRKYRESRSLESQPEKPVLLPKKKIIKRSNNIQDRSSSHFSPLGQSTILPPVIME